MNTRVVLDTSHPYYQLVLPDDKDATLYLRARTIETQLCVFSYLRYFGRKSRMCRPWPSDDLASLSLLPNKRWMPLNFGIDEYQVRPQDSLSLAVTMQMSAYDAQYLVLAQDTSAPLWALDKRLQQLTVDRVHLTFLSQYLYMTIYGR